MATLAPSPALGLCRYSLQEEIGRGGMSTVYRAFDRELRRPVAVKVLDPILALRRDALSRFAEEAQTTAQLMHPAIVPVYNMGMDERGRGFYAMKLVEGRTLADLVDAMRAGNESDYNRFRLVQVLIEVARAVAFAHSRGVVHRDLKPNNIMIGRHGEVQILDWGLAKIGVPLPVEDPVVQWNPFRPATQAGSIVGTPSYMAPEQADTSGPIGPGADIHALGATLYFVLVGQPPFVAPSARETLDLVRDGPRGGPRARDRSVPRELDAVCRKAMARRPQDRYASAGELAADLQAWLEGRPVEALPLGRVRRLVKAARRNRALSLTATAALVIVLVSQSVAMVAIHRERTDAVRHRHQAETSAGRAASKERLAQAYAEQAQGERRHAERLVQLVLQDLARELEGVSQLPLIEPAVAAADEYLRQRPATVGPDRSSGHIQRGMGEVLLRLGRPKEALTRYRQAAQRARALLAEAPGDDRRLRRVLITHWDLGDTARSLGDLPWATREYQRALAGFEQLCAREPDIPQWQHDLAQTHWKLGDVARDARQDRLFEEHYRRAARLLEPLDPSNHLWRQGAFYSRFWLAVSLAARGERELARQEVARAARTGCRPQLVAVWWAALNGEEGQLPASPSPSWWASVEGAMRGRVQPDALLAEARSAPSASEREARLCEAYAYLGMRAEARGRSRLAQACYRACLIYPFPDFVEVRFSRQRLRYLEDRPELLWSGR